MLVASFNGLYCSVTHLHVQQCQPESLMNTQQLYFYLHVIPYPGVDHLMELLAQTCINVQLRTQFIFLIPNLIQQRTNMIKK